ncbi:MAG: hypothetical protein LIP05_08435 [Tannerellaceae bacterium]|nr:hypothetical protein [Tannerellaceae bacterium]
MSTTSTVGETDIGKIAITPVENNLSSFDILDLIVKDGRAYLSKKQDNKDAVTVTGSWLKITENAYDQAVRLGLFSGTEAEWIASLSAASEEAAALAKAQTALCKTATDAANTAASNATSAATRAGSAAETATSTAKEAAAMVETAQDKAEKLDKVIRDAQEQTDSMRALEQSITNYVQSAPTRMELTYTQQITLGNPSEQRIEAKLFPAYVLQNVLCLSASGEDVVSVDPDGLLHFHKTGKAKIHVIPTHNVALFTTIEIEGKEPVMRLAGDGSIRLSSDGKIRKT